MNEIKLIGKITRKPEIRYTTSSIPCSTINIYEEEHKTFIDITLWEQLALDSEKLDKDDDVKVEGYVRKRSYEDKDKKKRYVTEIIGTSLSFDIVREEVKTLKENAQEEFEQTAQEKAQEEFEESIVITNDDLPF